MHRDHPLAEGLPASFEVEDELYFVELREPRESRLLLCELTARSLKLGLGVLGIEVVDQM